MTERELFECIRQEVKRFGWLLYHDYDSRRSTAGLPDLLLVRGDRLMFRELKSKRGWLSMEQRACIAALQAAGQDAGVWREDDWPDRIIAELR